jgi:O-antigen/teichoic acid export membrane protein
MLPAMSTAAAFFPLAVQIHARQGDAAVRAHFAECAELLFSITLPAALGFAMISWHVANVVLGTDFREIAAQIMPIVAVAVIFQIMTQQYLHASFLLSGHNGFYLINTMAIIAANVFLSYLLVRSHGAIGAAWARLGADVIGFFCALTRIAFPVPLPAGRLGLILIAGLVMALAVSALDKQLHVAHLTACLVLAAAGAMTYATLGWLFDISQARRRFRSVLAILHARRTKLTIGPNQ